MYPSPSRKAPSLVAYMFAYTSRYVARKRAWSPRMVRAIEGHGRRRHSAPSTSAPCSSAPVTGSTMTGSMPKKGSAALPGLAPMAPGIGAMTTLPVSVCQYDGAAPKAHLLVQPQPRLRVDWLADASNCAQRREGARWQEARVCPHQRPHRRRRRVELRQSVRANEMPVPPGVRIRRDALESVVALILVSIKQSAARKLLILTGRW
jgi:hypothetical protein